MYPPPTEVEERQSSSPSFTICSRLNSSMRASDRVSLPITFEKAAPIGRNDAGHAQASSRR